MANLPEQPQWEDGIYQLETTDPVVGGTPNPDTMEGIDNIPALQLANRTAFLKQLVDALSAGKVDTATLDARIDALLNGAPAAMDTLKELSDAIGDNDSELASLVSLIGTKLDASEAGSFLNLRGLADAATSVDAIVEPGIYRLGQTQPGAPSGSEYSHLIVFYAGFGAVVTQLLLPNGSEKNIHWRSGSPPPLGTGSWDGWKTIWHSGTPGLADSILALLDGKRIASGSAWMENGQFVWEEGVNRITNNDGGGNVQIRLGHEYSNGAERFTHPGTAFYIGGSVDDTDGNGNLLFKVAANGGAGTGEQVLWSDFLKIRNNEISFGGVSLFAPVGTVQAIAMGTPPAGWLECNGAAISRTAYADLYAKIGTLYGAGDGSTTFNIPDYRGEFLRGWDNGRGADPGRALGSWQSHALQHHSHSFTRPKSANDTDRGTGGGSLWSIDESETIPTGGVSGGNAASETRPRNKAVMYCIKY